jgi:hypothetical protein
MGRHFRRRQLVNIQLWLLMLVLLEAKQALTSHWL